jgi:hypothetical protein
MATQLRHPGHRVVPRPEPRRISASGAALLALGGGAGILMAFLGLTHLVPASLDGIAVILLGGSLVLAGTLLGRASEAANIPFAPGTGVRTGGFTSELILGLVAVVLGILALANLGTINFMAFGAIALGVSLWMGSLDVENFDRAVPQPDPEVQKEIDKSWGIDVVLGMAAVALGILAWMGVAPRTLALVAAIGIGIAMVVLGAVLIRQGSRKPEW